MNRLLTIAPYVLFIAAALAVSFATAQSPTALGGSRLISLKLERDLRAYYATKKPGKIPLPPIMPANQVDPLKRALARVLLGELKNEKSQGAQRLQMEIVQELLAP